MIQARIHAWQESYRASWGKRGKLERVLSTCISAVTLTFLLYILLRYKDFSYILTEDIPNTPWFFRMVFLYGMLFLFGLLALKTLCRQPLPLQVLGVFCMAALPRFALFILLPYSETGDFANFAEMGRMFLRGEYTALASQFTTLPDFMGLGLLDSLTMRIFGASTDGLRMSNCVYSSLSCVLLFLIGRRYDVRVGLLGAFLYAFYPASILAAETVGNPIPSALLLLLSIHLILLAISAKTRACFLLAMMSGCAMLLSHYMHPSSLTTILAITFFLLTLAFSCIRQPKAFLRLLCLYICFLAGLIGLRGACNRYFDSLGLRNASTGKQSDYYIVKLVMGLNPETNGNYCAEDVVWCAEQPKETLYSAAFARIRQRLPTSSAVLDMVDAKVVHTWVVRDTYYSMFFGGISNMIAEDEEVANRSGALETLKVARTGFAQSFILLDFFYVACLYLAAFLGVLLRKRSVRDVDLLLWGFLGFAGIFILIESQSRYRYPAMPMVCLLAGIGIHAVFRPIAGSVRGMAGTVGARPSATIPPAP